MFGSLKDVTNNLTLPINAAYTYLHRLLLKGVVENYISHLSLKRIICNCQAFGFLDFFKPRPLKLAYILITLKQLIKFEEEMHNKCLFTLQLYLSLDLFCFPSLR